jgi:hypothetical protein
MVSLLVLLRVDQKRNKNHQKSRIKIVKLNLTLKGLVFLNQE